MEKQIQIVIEAPQGPRPRKARPSSLQLAEQCERAPWLSHRYQEKSARTVYGSTADGQASLALAGGPEPQMPEAQALVAWARAKFSVGAVFHVQRQVSLRDPVTGELLTRGTPDLLVWVPMFRRLYVIDWKAKGQWWAGYLAKPDDNLQQLPYGVAGAMELGTDEFQVILALFDEQGNVDPQESKVYGADDWWSIIDRVKATPDFNPDGPEPAATTGDHCAKCWSRGHCSAQLLPAMRDVPEMPAALVPFTEAGSGQLTHDDAVAGLAWLDRAESAIKTATQVKKMVEGRLETFANQNGPIRVGDREWGPIPTPGRKKGLSVGEIEKSHPELAHLITVGDPGIKYDYRRVAPSTRAPATPSAPSERTSDDGG